MGQKNLKGTVSLTNADGKIRLRWRFQGVRYSINLSQYNKANLMEAKKTVLKIERDIFNQQFDFSLKRYKSKQQESPRIPEQERTTVRYFEEWTTSYRQMNCETNSDYHSLRNVLKSWEPVNEQTILTKLNGEVYSPSTYNSRLSLLKSFVRWLVKRGAWKQNPLEDVGSKRGKKKIDKKRTPFTEGELKSILKAFKDDTYRPSSSRFTHSHYYPFVYFLSKTGVRPAEAIGLRVGSISVTNKTIIIKEVMARSLKGTNAAQRIRKETKNGKERVLPLTPDLEIVLIPVIEGRVDDSLVFLSPKGLAIDDKMFQRRIFKPILKALKIEERVLYAYRHTFNSRCIDSGMTPVMTAFLMGNNPETALRNYTHQISVPNELPDI